MNDKKLLKDQLLSDLAKIRHKIEKTSKIPPSQLNRDIFKYKDNPEELVRSYIDQEGSTIRFKQLIEQNRPELAVEALVLSEKYSTLFNKDDIENARNNYEEAGIDFEEVIHKEWSNNENHEEGVTTKYLASKLGLDHTEVQLAYIEISDNYFLQKDKVCGELKTEGSTAYYSNLPPSMIVAIMIKLDVLDKWNELMLNIDDDDLLDPLFE